MGERPGIVPPMPLFGLEKHCHAQAGLADALQQVDHLRKQARGRADATPHATPNARDTTTHAHFTRQCPPHTLTLYH